MKIKVNYIMIQHTQDYMAIPEPIRAKLAKRYVAILYDNDQKRYTAALGDIHAMAKYQATKRYTIKTCLSPQAFVKELDARQGNAKNGLTTPDYSSLDTLDGAYMAAYELLRLKILQLAGERV